MHSPFTVSKFPVHIQFIPSVDVSFVGQVLHVDVSDVVGQLVEPSAIVMVDEFGAIVLSGHCMHWFQKKNLPAGHVNVPGQLYADSRPAPVYSAVPYWGIAHLLHFVRLASEYVPISHCVHCVWPDLVLIVPAGHAVHRPALASQ